MTEAKSLLEQLCLIGAGRPFYGAALRCMQGYVKDDLRRLDIPPAELLSRKPMNDPLEQIMLMTSVGVPSVIYDTLKDLRLARAYRLGAMQRKFPSLGIARPARCSAWPWPWPLAPLASCLHRSLPYHPPLLARLPLPSHPWLAGWHAVILGAGSAAAASPAPGRRSGRPLTRLVPASAAGAALPAGDARAARLPATWRRIL